MSEPKSIVIIGGSAGAKIATSIFRMTHPRHVLYYVECYADEIKTNRLYPTVEKSLDYLKNPEVDYFIATGDNLLRKTHHELIKLHTKKEPINCIHPTAVVESKRFGHGNMVCPNAVVHIDSYVGDCTIINTGSVVEHDCHLGNYSQISPNTTLCGYVHIGENCFISAGSTLIPKVKVGNNSIVAAGSVVIDDVPPNVMVAGTPSKIKKVYSL